MPAASTRPAERAHGIGEIQRSRMLLAAAGAARERGAAAVSVSDVVTRAGVSRRTFYEIFRDREDCLGGTLEEALARAARRVLPAWEGEAGWREAVRQALLAFLLFLDEEPAFGMFLLVDSLGAGDRALARRAEAVDVLVDAVDAGRRLARSPASLSRVSAEGVVGAVLAIVHDRLLERCRLADDASMTGLLCQLTGVVLLPYLGPAAAAREASRVRVQPARPGVQPAPAGDDLRDLAIRLTHRTALVLRVLALHPGVSNREAGVRAGIADQGQVSKLLWRLARAGLLENTGGSRERGEPNAWRLTATGVRVERAIRDPA